MEMLLDASEAKPNDVALLLWVLQSGWVRCPSPLDLTGTAMCSAWWLAAGMPGTVSWWSMAMRHAGSAAQQFDDGPPQTGSHGLT